MELLKQSMTLKTDILNRKPGVIWVHGAAMIDNMLKEELLDIMGIGPMGACKDLVKRVCGKIIRRNWNSSQIVWGDMI